MKKIAIATTFVAATAAALAVHASTDGAGSATSGDVVWMPLGEVVAKLEAQGYQVLDIEREDGRFYEVEMRDANGFAAEAYLDAVTGAPVPGMSDMEDDDSEANDD